jgi:hypothetical protein
VYDPNTNRMIVFAGQEDCGPSNNEVWVLENANGSGGTPSWTQLSPAGTAPAPRTGQSAIYDPATNEMVIFGGGTASGAVNEAWALSNANGIGGTPTWTQLSPGGSLPSARSAHIGTYNPTTNDMVIFGGGTASGSANDSWLLTYANGLGGTSSWIQLSPTGGPPSGRSNLVAVMSAATNRMTIFAGQNCPPSGCVALNDTWVLSVAAPPPIITITSPTATSYEINQPVAASYTCTNASNTVASCVGSVAGGDIDTSSLGSKTFTVNASDTSGNTSSKSVAYTVAQSSLAISLTAPTATTYTLNETVPSGYTCTDDETVTLCAGPVASGADIDTTSVGNKSFTVNATDIYTNSLSQSVNYIVDFSIFPLYDSTHAVKSGAVIPIKLQLVDAAGNDVSSAGTVVHATGAVMVSSSVSETVVSAGSANPDNDFRFDPTLGTTGGYIFNLSTKGYPTGTYLLNFTAGNDPTTHSVQFEVR